MKLDGRIATTGNEIPLRQVISKLTRQTDSRFSRIIRESGSITSLGIKQLRTRLTLWKLCNLARTMTTHLSIISGITKGAIDSIFSRMQPQPPALSMTAPAETTLLSNYPNPFNPETWIPYQLAKPAKVTVSIYAADGTLVRTLVFGHQPAGVYQDKSRAAYWDSKNELGEPVASGVYFYTLTAGDFTATRKMLILR